MSSSLLEILTLMEQVIREREVSAAPSVDGEQETQEFSISYPSFKITEKWGDPESEDRKTIEQFTSQIEGQTFEQKIKSINSFATDCRENCIQTRNVQQILASLIVLEAFVAIINDFNPQTGGFLFESLVAALIGAGAEQISTTGGRGQDIVDVKLKDGTPMGLKLYTEGKNYFRVSLDNAIRDYAKYGNKPIVQIIGIKSKDSVTNQIVKFDFYEFKVGTQEDVDSLNANFTIQQMGTKGIYELDIRNNDYYRATLDFGASKEELQEIAQLYSDSLGETMRAIYTNLKLLSDNVTKYYAGDTAAGRTARTNAENLKNATEDLD